MTQRPQDPDLHPTDRDADDARKRQRSKSDPEIHQAGSSAVERLSDGIAQPERRASDNPRSNISSSQTPVLGESPTSRDGTTSRRREANRLAAQRFRSRKKGYQDSLEERIRVLEEERDVLLNRLGEGPGESMFRLNDSGGQGASFSAAGSPEKKEAPIDVDVRIASLEAANRRLQEELKGLYEDNEVLREELERWRRWDVDTQPNLASQVSPACNISLMRSLTANSRTSPYRGIPFSHLSLSTKLAPQTTPLPTEYACHRLGCISTGLKTARYLRLPP